MPPLDPIADADWPSQIDDMLPGFAGKLNVYRTMAHHPALLRAWANLRHHLVLESSLPADLQELVILRTGHRWGSAYEWAHHVVRGRQAGLSEARIESARTEPVNAEGADALVLSAVDELLDGGRLSSEIVARLQAVAGKAGVLDLMATVGMYSTLAFILKSFETPLEPDIAAQT